jgi:vitamin K-dependent gamma-carboxylase
MAAPPERLTMIDAALARPAGAERVGGAWLARWRAHLLAEVDGASIALFRILFGLVMAWEVLRYFQHGWIARYYIEPGFHFSYLPLIQPWPGHGMYWHFVVTGLLALLVAAGLCYRVAAWLFCLAFSYIFLLDKAQYLNHFYLIALLSLLLAVVPAQRACSLDRARARRPGAPTVPRWGLLILRFQIAVVYVYGGVAKLNADWLSGQPLGEWLARRGDLFLIGPLLAQPWAGVAFGWGGLLIDLCVPFLLLWPRSFWLGALAAVAFNTLNGLIFSIGVFPWLMVAALVLFPQPGWPRALLGRRPPPSRRQTAPRTAARRVAPATLALLLTLHLYVAGQLLIPLRHWLYPSDVAWSEEGHRFAWRMKLRDKDASLALFATDPLSGATREIDPRIWLTARQASKMASRPDMIRQFARFVADEAERSGAPRPRVTALAVASLNGGPPSYLIDPAVDLAAAPGGLGPAAWILPQGGLAGGP